MAHLCQTEGSRHLSTHRGPVVDVDLPLTLAVVIVVMVMQQMVIFFSLNKRPVAISAPAEYTGWQLKSEKNLRCISLEVQLVLTWR